MQPVPCRFALATVRVPGLPYIYTPWPRFLMMMAGTDAIPSVDALKCTYHQHVQKSLEIVHLWRERDLIPGEDNTG